MTSLSDTHVFNAGDTMVVSNPPAAVPDLHDGQVDTGRIDADAKRLINCAQDDVNQLMPIKYKRAREHCHNGCANQLMSTEVPMTKDLETWRRDKLTPDERLVIMRNLGFFSTAESLVGNNLGLAIFKHVTNAECRQYLLRQAFE